MRPRIPPFFYPGKAAALDKASFVYGVKKRLLFMID